MKSWIGCNSSVVLFWSYNYQFLTQIYFLASYDVLDGKTIVHSLPGSTDFIKSSLLFLLKFANQKQGVLYNKVSESD